MTEQRKIKITDHPLIKLTGLIPPKTWVTEQSYMLRDMRFIFRVNFVMILSWLLWLAASLAPQLRWLYVVISLVNIALVYCSWKVYRMITTEITAMRYLDENLWEPTSARYVNIEEVLVQGLPRKLWVQITHANLWAWRVAVVAFALWMLWLFLASIIPLGIYVVVLLIILIATFFFLLPFISFPFMLVYIACMCMYMISVARLNMVNSFRYAAYALAYISAVSALALFAMIIVFIVTAVTEIDIMGYELVLSILYFTCTAMLFISLFVQGFLYYSIEKLDQSLSKLTTAVIKYEKSPKLK